MTKIAITGAKGTIGTVLRNGFKKDYDITPIDLPDTDVRDYSALLGVLPGHDAVIHLALDPTVENAGSDEIDIDNARMFYNVYRASLEANIKRVIMASSVHADDYSTWQGPDLLTLDTLIGPDSPYGASKVFMESLGRYYAKHGLEVICIRFGGVNLEDNPAFIEANYHKVWLSHRDCVELVRMCLEAKEVPSNFMIIYGVSNNTGRIHDSANPFGWVPRDNSADVLANFS